MKETNQSFNMYLPEPALEVLNKLESAGFESYVVGGCVRDAVMGKTPHDYDMCTQAEVSEIKEVFASYRTVDTGTKHGTVTVLSGGYSFEITTFRTDGDYIDHRRPESVEFTKNLEEDLKRRDFTVNAMAYSPLRGLVDKFGGRKDAENKIIRAVGVAEKRFDEDALRILRAVRFSAKLGFEIEAETFEAMIKQKEGLDFISKERIFSEFCGILQAPDGKHLGGVLNKCREILFQIIPELRNEDGVPQVNYFHDKDVFRHTVAAVSAGKNDLILRMTMLFHDIGKPHCFKMMPNGNTSFKGHAEYGCTLTEEILKRLKAPTKIVKEVTALVSIHEIPVKNAKTMTGAKMLYLAGSEERAYRLCDVLYCDTMGKSPASMKMYIPIVDKLRQDIYNYIYNNGCYTIKQLAVKGPDLFKIGIYGKGVGIMLDRLLSAVVDGDVKNEVYDLLEYAKKEKNNSNV